ncbi:hypothetical protein B0J18DRAFT_471661 [Chaetomium sp. MPI-SDFR-AT-0129]|nr:hypothetical protein B0J18DRAFT_471661 [Chaetomium sp. MPI-SDFR-AT-0129]
MLSPEPKTLRVAIIGLSASAITSWASTAHLPNLLSPSGRTRFRIVALCNSSLTAAHAAIAAYHLDPLTTRAYGDPDSLARDEEVDLVLVNTRVDKHLETALPSVKAGRDVFVEWPVARDQGEIEVLRQALRESRAAGKKGRVLVGLQGRWAPPVVRIKEFLREGRIGRLLSSRVEAYGGSRDREVLPVGLKYFAERRVGGNPVTIGFGHVVDFVQSVVGDLTPESTHAHFQLQRPNVRIRDPAQNDNIVETIASDVPDLLSLHGLTNIPATSLTADEHNNTSPATLTFHFRRGQPFPNTPSLIWTLHGTTGEIRLVAPAGISLQADAYAEPVTIHLHTFAKGDGPEAVEEVKWDWTESQREVGVRARGVQSVLFAFADAVLGGTLGDKEGWEERGWVELDEAAERAGQIEGWLEGFKG